MPSRNLSQYLIITLKGLAMGAADAVPGVSGGTIAFISGIYEELVTTISSINLSLLKTVKNEGILAFWKQLNGNFLVALLLGIVISFLTFMRLAKFLIEYHPVLIWSFFFGLILASIYYVGRQISSWSFNTFAAIIIGSIIAYFITTLPSQNTNENTLFLFIAGAIAICAMILPGISGSFILVVLGAYKTLSDAIADFNISRLLIFLSGAIIGLLSFSRILKWLFTNYKNSTLALLTGFIIGSLNKVWPWKETITVFSKEKGAVIPFQDVSNLGTLSVFQRIDHNFDSFKTGLEHSVSPFYYSEINDYLDPQIYLAIIFAIIGFISIFMLERISMLKNRQ